jgi:spermidine/putrescine-binding protein
LPIKTEEQRERAEAKVERLQKVAEEGRVAMAEYKAALELDPAFIDNQILLADTANGKALFGAQGRFRLVVPKDKPGARSVRMLTKLEVVQLRK